jgi:hypothetical protein
MLNGGAMDIILVGFIAGLTFGGWRTGLIHRLAGLAFMAISTLAPSGVPGLPGLPAR